MQTFGQTLADRRIFISIINSSLTDGLSQEVNLKAVFQPNLLKLARSLEQSSVVVFEIPWELLLIILKCKFYVWVVYEGKKAPVRWMSQLVTAVPRSSDSFHIPYLTQQLYLYVISTVSRRQKIICWI